MKLLVCFHVLLGALLLAIPNITRRELLFAVPVPRGFRQSSAGRHAIAMFRLVVTAIVVAGIVVFLLSPTRLINAIQPAVVLGTVVAAGIAFHWQYRALTPFAVEIAGKREAELTTAPERLPWFAWLGLCPFGVIGAAALYLRLNWERIPDRFPVHWGVDGPDRWAQRTTKGVYGILIFAAELSVFLLIMALASWYGARRSRSRPVMLGGMIAVNCVVGCLFASIAVQPVLDIPFWVIISGIMSVIIAIVIVMVNKMSEPGEGPDPTPLACWKGGVIYYNPNDAALFVERREGLGYTFNFANRWSWVLLAGLVLVMASAVFVTG